MPTWILRHGVRCMPGAAGAKGMGCIGFPSHAVWEITARCNLNCIHCHVSPVESRTELSTSEGKALLTQLAAVEEFRMVAFTGGEPLMRMDLFELLNHSRELGFSNTIATNGTLIDGDVAAELRDAGVSIAAVSLDGDRDTHDGIRGEGAYDGAIAGMEALVDAGIVLHVNITLMRNNLEQFESLMADVEDLGAGIVLVYQLVPTGRGRGIRHSILGRDGNMDLCRLLLKAQRGSTAIVETVAGPQYWAFLLRRAGISGGVALSMAEKVFHGCSAGRGMVYIKPNGDVIPCPFLPINCGSLRDREFIEIWNESEVLDDLRARRLKGACGRCEYSQVCGGCRGRAFSVSGDYLGEDPACFLRDLDPTAAEAGRGEVLDRRG